MTTTDQRAAARTTVALIAAVIAFAVQQTAIVPAVHDVQEYFGSSPEWVSWLVTVYLMVATVATMAMGRLGDLHGRRRMLMVGLAVFAVGSIGAALAPSLIVLILFRAVQGVGGAVYPLALALARDAVPENRSTMTISLLSGAFGVGTALGFVGGGVLAEHASWRLVFAAGAVLVVAGAWLVHRDVGESGERAGGSYDLLGTVLLGTSALALLAGLTLIVSLGPASPATVGLLALAVVTAVLWVRHERRTDDPLVDLGVLGSRPVALTNLATIALGWALFGGYLLIPQFARGEPAHDGYGLAASSTVVGLVMLPLAVAQTVCGPLAGLLSRRLPARVVFAAGLSLVAAGMVVLAATSTSLWATVAGAVALGMGAGAGLQAGSAVTTEAVAPDVAAVSASVNSTVRRLAGGVGGQVATIVLAGIAFGPGRPEFAAFPVSYLVSAGLCVLGAGCALLVRPR